MLEGKVGEFSLPEIFQLIALTKKSGVLTVASASQHGRVRFRDGEVCEAASDVHRLALGAHLVGAGLVEEAQLVAALEAKRDRGGEVLRLLLEHAAIDEGALHAFVREQIADAVVDLLRLEDATFRFDPDQDDSEPIINVQVAADQLVTEGNQRLSEWDSIREHVGSLDAVPALSPRVPDDGEVALDPESWRLLALIDGRRSVREIVDLCGQGDFATTKVLAVLARRGLVHIGETGDDGPLAPLLARREVLRRLEELELSERPPDPPQPASHEPGPPPPASHDEGDAEPAETPALDLVPPAPDPVDGAGGTAEGTSDEAGAGDGSGEVGEDGESVAAGGVGVQDWVPEPSTNGAAPAEIDRAQVARELASLGLADEPAAPPATSPADASGREPSADGVATSAQRRLVRDEELNKGLLLRLIDGVKGA